MTTYLIVDIAVHAPEQYKEYVSRVPKIIEKHGGKYLVRGGEAQVKEGDWRPERLVILEFPSRENAEGFMQDPEYQTVAAIRHATARTNLVMAEGYQED